MAAQNTLRIVRRSFAGLAGIGAAAWLTAALTAGGQTTHSMPPRAMPMGSMAAMTTEQKIANAMTAAPAAIAAKATVLDWPAKDGDQPMVLRKGTNAWTCLPDMPGSEGNDPMCVDEPWMQWVDAYTKHQPPHITRVGIGYMVAAGGGWGSNTDPYAAAKTATNQWHLAPPHLMILVPDLKSLDGISSDPRTGGPYVMFAGTPYAHIMAPLTDATMHEHSHK